MNSVLCGAEGQLKVASAVVGGKLVKVERVGEEAVDESTER